MDRKIIPEAENKLVILYALMRLGPCTAMQLLQFMVECDLMNYFTLQLALCEMEEQGQLTQKAHPFGGLLIVTSQGAYTIEAFDHRIPASRRAVIDREAPAWHERFRLEQQTPAEVVDMPGGKCVHMQLLEGDAMLLDVMLSVPDGDAATVFLQRRWREVAQEAYQLVCQLLSQNYPEDGELPPLPEGAELQPSAKGDYLLSLCCTGQNALTVSLPYERMALWCAQQWQQYGDTLQTAILELLRLSLKGNL